MIKGQEKLYQQIDSFTISTLPHSILLLGEEGSGHIEICQYIADKFNMNIYDLTDFISLEFINEINSTNTISLYHVDISRITEKEQNIILKLFEEPNPFTYIVLNCYSDDSVIETIKSRSYILKMSKYTHEQLSELTDNELILKICTTPGQIEIANRTDMTKLYNLCETILKSISTANYQNTLSISNMINFKDEYDKYDLKLFIRTLKYVILMGNYEKGLQIYTELNKMAKKIESMNSKQIYFEHFLTDIWNLTRC